MDREIPGGGRIRRTWALYSANAKNFFILNLMCVVALIPALIIVLYLRTQWEAAAVAGLSFDSNLGFGNASAFDDVRLGLIGIMEVRRLVFAYLVPCVALLGVAMSGVFYVARNVNWAIPINVYRHFLRGVKKYWWVFLIAFAVLGAAVFLVGHSVLSLLIMQKEAGRADAGAWCYAVFMCILALIVYVYLMFFLPHVVCYKAKPAVHFKNAGIYGVSLILTTFFNLIGMTVPFLLLLFQGSTMLLIFAVIFGVFGFSFYANWMTSYAQYAFDNYEERIYFIKQKELTKAEREAQAGLGAKKANAQRVKHYSYKKKK